MEIHPDSFDFHQICASISKPIALREGFFVKKNVELSHVRISNKDFSFEPIIGNCFFSLKFLFFEENFVPALVTKIRNKIKHIRVYVAIEYIMNLFNTGIS
jgi:hypothetical protein